MARQNKGFDADAFYRALVTTVETRETNWKTVSRDTGVSQSTLTRMAQGKQPDAASLAVLSAWAGVNPVDYVASNVSARAPEALVAVTRALHQDPNLTPEAAKSLENILKSAYKGLKTVK